MPFCSFLHKIRKPAMAALLLALPLSGCGPGGEGGGDFALIPPQGGPAITLSQNAGKVVLLSFWSVYCGACINIHPFLSGMHAKYGQKGLSVIGVNVGDSKEEVLRYMEDYKIAYPVGIDADRRAGIKYRVRGTPDFVLIDKKGKVIRSWLGYSYVLNTDIDSAVQELLKEPA